MSETRKYPPHQTKRRYKMGCRCRGCMNTLRARREMPEELRWPGTRLVRFFTKEVVRKWIGPEDTERILKEDLTDEEADRLCVRMGIMPHEVFPGWFMAGEDFDVYP